MQTSTLPFCRAAAAWLRATSLGTALALTAAAAVAQADPPGRVARIEVAEGTVGFQPASDGQARSADPRWPLTAGDQVWTENAGRAELHAGAATLRLGGTTALEFTALDDLNAQIKLTGGTLGVVVRDLQPGERFEIDTPNLALVLSRPGRWRIDVDAGQGLTRLYAEQGSGTLYGENAQGVAMASPQRRDFTGRNLVSPPPLAVVAGDAFDRWSDERDRLESRSVASRYVSPDVPGTQQLDGYGDWDSDPSYGPIWYPRAVAADWAPYRYGHWEWIDPWGWTWIDDAPWGFAPFHYGRWAQNGNRWGWVPGPQQARAAYAPALVGFVGSNAANGTLNLGDGRPGVGWFPLAPREAWRPPYPASPGYIARLNRAGFTQDNTNGYYYQTRPSAVTAVGAGDFGRRPVQAARQAMLPQAELSRGMAVPPPMGRGGYGGGGPGVRFERGPSLAAQPLPPGASPGDRMRQEQWQRSQQALEERQRGELMRQQQQRGAQDRFQPDYQQRQLQMQREGQQLQLQRDQFERQRQQQDQQRQQQQQFNQQMQAQQAQQRQAQEQQRQAQETQQRQMQEQQRQAAQQQRAAQPPQQQGSPDGRGYRPPRAAPQQH